MLNKVDKKSKTQELENQIKDLTEKWKRALADYANLEKRVITEKEEFSKFFNAVLLQKLLTVLDNLEKAETHLKDQGLTLALNGFRQVLKEQGLEEFKAANIKFDPQEMECVEIVAGRKDNVCEVCQKGYLLNNKIFRPAKVKVGQAPQKENNEAVKGGTK